MRASFFVAILFILAKLRFQSVQGLSDSQIERPGLRSHFKENSEFSSISKNRSSFEARSLSGEVSFLKVAEEVRVNTFTSLNQEETRVAALSDGKIVVAYMSNLQDGSGEGVYYRMFDRKGAPLMDTESSVTELTDDDQSLPSVAALPSGRFIISWQTGHSATDLDIFARVFLNDGSPEGSEFLVNDVSLDGIDQTRPHVVALDNAQIIIFFSDNTSGIPQIKGQLLNPSGQKINTNFNAHSPKILRQEYPQAVSLTNSNVFLVWEDGGVYGSISGTIIHTDGSVEVPEFPISTSSFNLRPSVCRLNNGSQFIVTWCSGFPLANKVVGQVFDSNGNLVGSQIDVTPNPAFFVSSTVACLAEGGFAVAYADASDSNFVQIVRYDEDFVVSGTPYDYSNGANGDYPSATATISGGLVFTWSRNPPLLSSPDVFLSVAQPCPDFFPLKGGIGENCPCPSNKISTDDGSCVCVVANSDPVTCECAEGQFLSENTCVGNRVLMSDLKVV